MSFFRRYGLAFTAVVYTATLLVLHALGKFPAPGPYDLSRLTGSPVITLEGTVANFPQTRWNQTRFLLEGRALPLHAFQGRALVNLRFPQDDLAPGERLRVRGWLSGTRPASRRRPFDEQRYWAASGVFSRLQVWSPAALERLDTATTPTWQQRAWLFHQRFKAFWSENLPADEAALIACMTLGSRGVLPPEVKDQCIRAGVYHILVVSGQNMALIIMLGVGCLSLLEVPRRWAVWICLGPILFYTAAVGADPPVTRAAAMAVVTLALFALGRDTPRYVPFILAWLWILVMQPEALFGASFQLSFGATASLIAVWPYLPRLKRIPSGVLRWAAEAGVVSLTVHLGVWPLLLIYFQQLSLAGILANWTIFPLSGAIMVLGLLIGTLGVFLPAAVPEIALDSMHGILKGSLAAVAEMSHWRWAAIRLPAPSLTVCAVYYAVLIGILIKIRHAKIRT